MGGWSSGRYRTRNRGTVERSLRFDIRLLRRRGYVRAGAWSSGTWGWNLGGEPCGSIAFTIDLTDPDNAFAELRFAVNGDPRSQRIAILATPCRYGGLRFYFYCPNSWQRCEVLCGVGGVFAARDFHRLTYQSQSEAPLDRVKRAEQKTEARLFGKDGNPRPRGANRERLLHRWSDLSEQWNVALAAYAFRQWGMEF